MKLSRPTVFITAMIIPTISLLLFSAYLYRSSENKRIIYKHRNEYHHIIGKLFDKRIVKFQSGKHLISKYRPSKMSTHDNYITLQYYKNNEGLDDCCANFTHYIHIIIKDNKLVKAFAGQGVLSLIEYVFFDVLSESEEDEYWDSRFGAKTTNLNL